MSNTCFIFHKWSKWGGLIEQRWIQGDNVFTGANGVGDFMRLAQERECEKCGAKQRRFVQ